MLEANKETHLKIIILSYVGVFLAFLLYKIYKCKQKQKSDAELKSALFKDFQDHLKSYTLDISTIKENPDQITRLFKFLQDLYIENIDNAHSDDRQQRELQSKKLMLAQKRVLDISCKICSKFGKTYVEKTNFKICMEKLAVFENMSCAYCNLIPAVSESEKRRRVQCLILAVETYQQFLEIYSSNFIYKYEKNDDKRKILDSFNLNIESCKRIVKNLRSLKINSNLKSETDLLSQKLAIDFNVTVLEKSIVNIAK